MNRRVLEVDALALPDHHYLDAGDTCYYAGEYTAGENHAYSDTNQLILNLKKSVDRRGRPEWRYKEQAITQAAAMFRAALNERAQLILVPVPPSKALTDPAYDDRMLRLLQQVSVNRPYDVRELVIQTYSTPAAHLADRRPTPNELVAIYRLNETLALPEPQTIFIVDDVLTTGCHYKAVKQLLARRFPNAAIYGLFVARRVPKSVADAFEALE
ncbi:hypothetical protein [Metallibacterium scheffleri]|uniref:Phosphoribosyltransferase domain-containing protein n=1 Tax=Metallibacterium scheffleri TaxID=993689 RepID=A0A4V3UTN1_9GAMM|nr:hypothetical protein [Metallibacterium scheffleri]THD11271.1 hypothetical protein B1806_03900 [Metallibacterium scheffleri]